MQPIREAFLPLRFRVSGSLQGLNIDAYLPKDFMPLTRSCSYAAASGQVIRVPEKQRHLTRVLWQQAIEGHAGFAYGVQDAPKVVGSLLPFLRLCGIV